ncbi:thioredoxin family protein [Nocardioides sp. TRM66260-LWL]|uniref:thioredoxin family protein n=1 Tax=Nocardioides sp. TRM66260-LWL TaxID=2874478 RepID=UPI001CC4587E|nr:thioredoxin family protein [Nocardioides sp. TRM66260-LWL]MBZ5733529.1 thioredoxin family protein [Nocardioides sp. TRM66260-LWL]
MQVELLYFSGCPNWQVADDRLMEALTVLGRADIVVERRPIETLAEAEEVGLVGSPTIRIDGIDPFATGQELVGLACRVYATPAGLRGAPDTAQLVEVLA